MELPSSFLLTIGILIAGNIGVIITMITFIFKAGQFVADTKSGILEAKESSINAHKRIDHIEKYV